MNDDDRGDSPRSPRRSPSPKSPGIYGRQAIGAQDTRWDAYVLVDGGGSEGGEECAVPGGRALETRTTRDNFPRIQR